MDVKKLAIHGLAIFGAVAVVALLLAKFRGASSDAAA